MHPFSFSGVLCRLSSEQVLGVGPGCCVTMQSGSMSLYSELSGHSFLFSALYHRCLLSSLSRSFFCVCESLYISFFYNTCCPYRSTETRSHYLSPTLLTPGMAFLSYIVQIRLSTSSSLIRHDSIFPVYCLPLSLPNQDTSFTTWHKLALSFSDTFFFFFS